MKRRNNETEFLEAVPIELSEPASEGGAKTVPTRIQIARTGSFLNKKLQIDKAFLASLKKNFDARVRRIDIAADFNHAKDNAAGWYKELIPSDNGEELFAEMKWTPRAEREIAAGEWRYFSPGVHPNYLDEETGKTYGPTLVSGGITNYPVIKGMAPATELSEGDDEMTAEEIKKLQDDLTAEQLKTKALGAKVTELSEKVQSAEKATQLAEKEKKFAVMLSEGKAVPAQKEAYLAGDTEKFAELAGKVELSERGHGGNGEGDKGGKKDSKSATPAQDQILELAEKKREKDKDLDLGDAVSLVLSENKDLAAEYAKETAF
jgi:hypothetical protein